MNIEGSLVALVTPMDPEGQIDWESLERLVTWHIDAGTHGIVAVGTTGESATLSMSEHHQVIQQVVSWASGRMAVVGGTGANNTQEAIELTRQAAKAGVDACLLVTPYYNKPTQEGLFLHYQAIAYQIDVPQILYNVPGRTAVDLQLETVLRLTALPNIIGIKDATGDLERGRALIEAVPADFSVYSGDDLTAAELMLMGAVGNISVTANLLPKAMHYLAEWALSGEVSRVRALQSALMPLHEILFVESNPIPVKWALAALGKILDGIRLPLSPLSQQYQSQLMETMRSVEQSVLSLLSDNAQVNTDHV